MSARITGAFVALLLSAATCGLLIAGCGSEPAEEPAATVTVDEVPIVGNTTADDHPADAPELAEEPEPEAPPEPADEPAPPAVEESPGFWTRVGGGLRAAATFIGRLIFVLILPAAIAGTLLGMPGGVLVFADALVFSAFHGWATPPWWVLLILVLIAAGAEAAENALSFAGVKQSGASNSTGVWTMVGGLAGAIFGGILAPLLASIGALAGPAGWIILSIVPPIGFGMLGGFLGGYLFELRCGKTPEEAKSAGWGAMLGRLAGSFTKALLVAVMAAIVLISTWGALF